LRKVVLALGFTILQSLCCCGGRGDSVIDRPIFIGGLKAILYEYAYRIHCALPAIVTGCTDAAVDLEVAATISAISSATDAASNRNQCKFTAREASR
jgi:hypothetical protein